MVYEILVSYFKPLSIQQLQGYLKLLGFLCGVKSTMHNLFFLLGDIPACYRV